jgi:hypothetical protein
MRTTCCFDRDCCITERAIFCSRVRWWFFLEPVYVLDDQKDRKGTIRKLIIVLMKIPMLIETAPVALAAARLA